LVYSYNLLKSKNRHINKIDIPINPVSSAREAKIKSVLASGKNLSCVCVPHPAPLPNNLPLPIAIIACFKL